jgi:hypothetical protein
MSDSSSVLTAFNDHFMEFVNDINTVFPDNTDILTAKKSFIMFRKANPKMIIQIWYIFIVSKYSSEIEKGNIDFFLSKDYSDDLNQLDYSDKIMKSIDQLRNPIKMMTKEEQEKIMVYIKNLTKLSTIYFST